jgi:hypothetical protein
MDQKIEKDKAIIIAIVKERAESMTGEQSTKHSSVPKGSEWDGETVTE